MKKIIVFLVAICCILISCEKDGGRYCNVQKAINSLSNKESATSLTINGELTSEDIAIIADIRSQVPNIESITLSEATMIPDKAFAIKEGIAWGANTWLKSISCPNVTSIGQSSFARCLNLKSVSFPKLEKIDYNAFWTCESLMSIDLSKVTTIESEAFMACESLTTVSLPLIIELKDATFAGCKSLKSLDLPVVNSIKATALRACDALINLNLGSITAIAFDTENLDINTNNVDLVLEGEEAGNAVGNYWKGKVWKSITSTKSTIKKPIFGVAYWGCTMSYVKEVETRQLKTSTSTSLTYRDKNNGNISWHYAFDREGNFAWGETDYSYQYDHNPSLVTLPIREYQNEITSLINKFGTPTSKTEDIFAYDPNDMEDSEGHAYWFSKQIMNNFYNAYVEYQWITSDTKVTSRLSYYPNRTKDWGFSIISTYYPAK